LNENGVRKKPALYNFALLARIIKNINARTRLKLGNYAPKRPGSGTIHRHDEESFFSDGALPDHTEAYSAQEYQISPSLL
jgi:hypothetical protein